MKFMWREIESANDLPQDGSECVCYDIYSKSLLICSYQNFNDNILIASQKNAYDDCVPTHILEIDNFPIEEEDD